VTEHDPRTERPDGEDAGRPAPVVRDRRRIDPQTGAVREPDAAQAPAAADQPAAPEQQPEQQDQQEDRVAQLTQALAERTADLQRLQAEYVNYKRRVDRDRQANRELAVASVLTELLHTLDDIGRARDAGELEGAFKAVAESVERVAEKAGLVRYGEVGDAFDPRIHEALMHNYSDDVDGPTATMVMQPGYRLGDRILRAARVAVSEPTEQLPEQPATEEIAEGNDVQQDNEKDQAGE
jgi:molecular chaperone GrpE